MAILGTYGYDGGLNTDASLVTLPKGQLTALQNMIVKQGQLQNIAGYSTASITQPPSVSGNQDLGLLGCSINTNNYLFLVGVNVTTPYAYVLENLTGSWSSNIISSSGFSSEYSVGYCIEVLNNIITIGSQNAVISSAQGGTAAQWNGSGNLTSFPGPSNVGIFRMVNNFLFALKYDGTVSWSNAGDPTTWTAGNSIIFRPGDGDIGTALGKIGTNLYIFKLNSIGCLQTNSVVLAGAVTLGPLYTIFDKIGTFGMRSIDNLPTGEIVFVGTDYNVYKFDGSNITNLSNRPYPQSSIQGAINSFLNSYGNGIPSNNIWLKVNPLQNLIFLTFGGETLHTNASAFWAYDYVQDYWLYLGNLSTANYTFGDYVYVTSIGNISSYFSSGPTNLFLGLDNFGSPSKLYSIASNYTTFNGEAISSTATISVPYTAESRDKIPLSAIVPFTGNSSDTLTITQGADGIYGTGTNVTPTGNLQRNIVPLLFEDSTMTAQIEMQFSSSNAFSINPVILDTEYAH